MAGIEVRAGTLEVVDTGQRVVLATVVPYEREEQVEPGRWQVFDRGAFLGSLADPKRVKVKVQHEGREVVIGCAVRLQTRRGGLQAALRIVDTQAGRDMLMLLSARVVDMIGVSFVPQRVTRTPRAAGGVLERFEEAELVEVSPVVLAWDTHAAKILGARDRWRESRRQAELEALEALTAG